MMNPKQIVMNIIRSNPQMQSNQMLQNMIGLAEKGDIRGIENIGRNAAKEKGIDFDKEFYKFKNQFPFR